MEPETRVESLIAPILSAMGYGVVRVRLCGNVRRILQIMIERMDDGKVTVDDCAASSEAISAALDVEDPIRGAYRLEVSSPGIDRPLVKRADFERYAGFEARIETHRAIDGRRRFRGRLAGVEGGLVRIALEGGSARIPLDDIAAAQLVLSDELIAATRNAG